MKCDNLYCPICRWGECVGDRIAAKVFGWCDKTEKETEEEGLHEFD